MIKSKAIRSPARLPVRVSSQEGKPPMWFKKFWPTCLAFLLQAPTVWNWIKSYLDWRGRLDTLVETYHELGGAYAMIGYVLNPPPWFYPLAFIAGLMLIWWNFRKNAAPNAVKSAQSLKDTQVLFNSAITPAHEAILAVINAMLQALQSSPDQNIRNLARAAHQGATDLAQTTYGNLARAVRGADSDEKQLQRLVGWFWNEYRLQTSFIKDNITAVRETSSNILNAPIFEQWLESDQRLRDALRSYCGPQNRDTIRSSMASNGWNDEVIRQIRSLRSSVMAIAAKKCAESRIMTNKPTKSLKLRPSRMEMVRIPLLSALAHDQCSSS